MFRCTLSTDTVFLVGSSGKASHGVAIRINAMSTAQANTTSVVGEVARTRKALEERGEKLSELDMK